VKVALSLLVSLVCLVPPCLGDTKVRVMTYNIHHAEGLEGRVDLDRIAAVIRAAHADVVCLQEVDRNLPRTNNLDFPALLAQKLDMAVVFEPNYQLDGGDYGNATLTRFEIVSHENIHLPAPPGREPRGCLRTTVRVEGQLLDVLNTHLGLGVAERKAQAAAIFDRLGKGPTVLAGDMNEDEQGSALGILFGKLSDTQAKETGPARFTWPANAPEVRIDFILVSEDVHVLSPAILVTAEMAVASDHLPYVADLSLRAPRDKAAEEGIHDNEDERVTEALQALEL